MDPLPDRLPLVIGVTGHRDLRPQDVPRLEQEVAAVIAGLRRHYLRGGGETPVIVLSALAEGADRLVARVALAQGVKLVAPLPLPVEDYRRDFDPGLEPGNMAEFDELFAQAIVAPVMPVSPNKEGLPADDLRNQQYRAAGFFIAQHCDVLLALWDGDAANLSPGGTADVVKAKLQGFPIEVTGSARASLDGSEIGPVIHIVTPRQKETSPAREVSVAPWGRGVVKRYRGGILRRGLREMVRPILHLFGRDLPHVRPGLPLAQRRELEAWETFGMLVGLTREFNRDAAALAAAPEGTQRLATSIGYLFADPETGSIDRDAETHATEAAPRWCRLYGIADTLAQDCQKQFRRDWFLLFLFGFVAFCCFALFSHLSLASDFLLGLYSGCFALIFILILRARVGQHQERFLDYRAFAEALRVGVYWKLVGIGGRHVDVGVVSMPESMVFDVGSRRVMAAAYPIKQPSELAWVKICLRTLELLDRAGNASSDNGFQPAGHAIAHRFWVLGQRAYYGRQGTRHNHTANVLESRSALLVALSPFVIVPLLLLKFIPESWMMPAWLAALLPSAWQPLNPSHVSIIFIGLLPGVAAVMTGYAERLALKAQARQYDRMRMLFERAAELLEQIDAKGGPLAQALYAELGIEAMKETSEWVAIYRQRPIQPLQ
jgi:hypothetical protein